MCPGEPERAAATVLCYLEGQVRTGQPVMTPPEQLVHLFGHDLRARGLADLALLKLEHEGLIDFLPGGRGGVRLLGRGRRRADEILTRVEVALLPDEPPEWLP